MSDRPTPTRAIPHQATSSVAFVGSPPEDDDPLLAFAPFIHKQPRRNSITPERQRAFVAHLAATGIVTQAARHIGKSMEALYKLRSRPGAEGFAAAWDAALERGVQRLEDCALERAIAGEERPVVSGGKLLGSYKRYDNNLLRFLLQHRMPQRYGVHQIKPGHPVYESIRKEVLEEQARIAMENEDEILASIDRKLETMRQRDLAAKKLLAEDGDADGQ